MTMTPEIEEFARGLMESVRDESIRSNDMGLRPPARSPVAKRWEKASRTENPVGFATVMIPDVVDETIFYLLHAIDEGLLKISFTASNGKIVDLAAAGQSELAGWFMGTDGWREKYSQERFVDDLADLAGGERSRTET